VIENQALEEFGYTGSKRDCWMKGGRRVGRFSRFVYEDNGGGIPGGGGLVEHGEMLLSRRRCVRRG